MSCPRCKKRFTNERLSFFKWLVPRREAMHPSCVMFDNGLLYYKVYSGMLKNFFSTEDKSFLKRK